jgi:hypothetical protein
MYHEHARSSEVACSFDKLWHTGSRLHQNLNPANTRDQIDNRGLCSYLSTATSSVLLFTSTPLVCILYLSKIHSLLLIRPAYPTLHPRTHNYSRHHKPEAPSKLPQSNQIPSSTTTNMASNGQTSLAPSKCVGPEYKSDKPTATVSTEIPHENVHILPQTPQLISLLTYVLLEALSVEVQLYRH